MFDEFAHAGAIVLLRLLLGFAASEHNLPHSIDLHFDVFGVGDKGVLVVPEVVAKVFERAHFSRDSGHGTQRREGVRQLGLRPGHCWWC